MQHNNPEIDQPYDEDQLPETLQHNVICPHCAHPMTELDHLCPNCGGPVTATAMIDPMARIYSMGFCARRLTPEITSKPIFVMAAWLILGPIMLFSGLLSVIALDQFLTIFGWEFLGNTTIVINAHSRMQYVFQLALYALIFTGSLAYLFKMTKAAIARRQSTSISPE